LQLEQQTQNVAQDSQNGHRWGVILAGGEGKRLLPFTQKITGDDRPKQFCNVIGRETLLSQTRARVSRMVHPGQTLVALTKIHEPFYANEVATVPPRLLLVQPQNKGTAPAIAYCVMRVYEADPDALVAFFPSDHHFANEQALNHYIDLAFALAAFHPELVIILGIAPERVEPGYGWIEPGPALSNPLPVCARRVRRFWEKPSQAIASTLLECGCLWNSFVMVGHVGAFHDLIRRTLPSLDASIGSLRRSLDTESAQDELAHLYSEISTADFAHKALAVHPDDLAVLCGFGLGWSDLGEPHRVLSARAQHPPQRS
jgi:mannose-1-phosphate guanylyltransferase